MTGGRSGGSAHVVSIDGRQWKIALEPSGTDGSVIAIVKGRRRTLDVAWIDATTLSLISTGGSGRSVTEVGIRRTDGGGFDLIVSGRTYHAVIEPKSGLKEAAHRPAGLGRRSVVAPMPGRIVRVLTAAGDRVNTGQPVIVIEAMKMENELRAPGDGVVREVKVLPDTAVDAGAVLVVIE